MGRDRGALPRGRRPLSDGDGSDVPVGTVYVALADGKRVFLRRLSLAKFDRERVRLVAASEALDLLRRVCIGLDPAAEDFGA